MTLKTDNERYSDLSSATRFRTVDASGFFDLSRTIPLKFIARPRTMVFWPLAAAGRLLFELGRSRQARYTLFLSASFWT